MGEINIKKELNIDAFFERTRFYSKKLLRELPKMQHKLDYITSYKTKIRTVQCPYEGSGACYKGSMKSKV